MPENTVNYVSGKYEVHNKILINRAIPMKYKNKNVHKSRLNNISDY